MYNSTVDWSSRQILTAGVPGVLTGKIPSVWTSKLDFIDLIHVDKKQHFFIQFAVIIENGCWRDRRMFRGSIKRNPGGSQSLSLSPLITRGHNRKHLLPPYNAVQITCEHKCSSEQTLLCGSLPSLPQPQSESLFNLLS